MNPTLPHTQKTRRPISIWIAVFFLTGLGLIFLTVTAYLTVAYFRGTLVSQSGVKAPVLFYGTPFLGLAFLVAAVGIIRHRNWGRFLGVTSPLILIILYIQAFLTKLLDNTWARFELISVLSIIVVPGLAVIGLLSLGKKVNEYFSPSTVQDDPLPEPPAPPVF